jgi:hypothetical protein
MHLVTLWVREMGGAPPMGPASMARCAEAIEQGVIRDSLAEKEVWRVLDALDALDATHGHTVPEGYSVDVLVKYAGHDFLLEFDGPVHFLGHVGERGQRLPPRPNGKTALKRRLFDSFGRTLVTVPYWEWDEVSGKDELPVGKEGGGSREASAAASIGRQREYLLGKMIRALSERQARGREAPRAGEEPAPELVVEQARP